VLDCDLVVMPVHLAMHWTCAVINLRDHEFLYLDSMGVRCYVPLSCTHSRGASHVWTT